MSLRSHFDFTSSTFQFHFDFTLNSLRYHFDLTLISLWSHVDFTLISLWFHFDITVISLWFRFCFTLISPWPHFNLTLVSLWFHVDLTLTCFDLMLISRWSFMFMSVFDLTSVKKGHSNKRKGERKLMGRQGKVNAQNPRDPNVPRISSYYQLRAHARTALNYLNVGLTPNLRSIGNLGCFCKDLHGNILKPNVQMCRGRYDADNPAISSNTSILTVCPWTRATRNTEFDQGVSWK